MDRNPAPTDATHDPNLQSWVESANGHPDFPIQNLPLGVFSTGNDAPRIGVAIGDEILDLAGVAAHLPGALHPLATARTLNGLFAAGAALRNALRRALSTLLADGFEGRHDLQSQLRHAADCALHLPAEIGDYTDFYVGIHHATNVGRLFRPDQPLMPNYKWVPIGYHGRASTVRPSGEDVRRPNGQRKRPNEEAPSFGPSRNLDYELELGIWIGHGNDAGAPIAIGEAADHIAGFCLLNDWSARDIQGWEYQPLGPFLAKSFATTISPWVVTPEALAPYRIAQAARPQGDPAPLGYLSDAQDQHSGALDIELEALIATARMREAGMQPQRLALSSTRHMYWTLAQLVAHHSSNGCTLRPGDLFGSGTLSAPTPDGFGSLLETTNGGKEALTLANGETRRFLEDGDEIILKARARREGAASIGFGECRAIILPALPGGTP